MDIFNPKFVRPADSSLFYSRGDANDRRLGEQVLRSFDFYGDAQVVLVGCPQDEGVKRNFGRAGAAAGPAEIRRWLYRFSSHGIDSVRLLDLGDVIPQKTLESTHSMMQQWLQQLLEDGKRVIVLGGGNDISYPDCSALSFVAPELLAFNIDAHFDVRADEPCNSGTPYRQLIDGGYVKPEMLYIIGFQQQLNSPVYAKWLRERGVNSASLSALRELGVTQTFRRVLRSKKRFDAIFWGFDLDVVRAADAPGVSAPSPCGLSAEEFCQIAAIAGSEPKTRVIEFTEVNPAFDVDGRTARLAATAIYHYLAALSHPE